MRVWITAIVVLLVLVVAGLSAVGLGIIPLESEPREVEQVSPAAASSAEIKLAQMDLPGEEARLTAAELTSLFRYRPEIWSLGILRTPEVEISGDTVSVRGRFASADLPPDPEIDRLRAFFPDTADVHLKGTVRLLGPGTTVLHVQEIEVAGMPIPARFYSPVLERFGQSSASGLPAGSVPLPLPEGIASIRTENGDLVLTR